MGNAALQEALQEAADPALYEAAGEGAAAFGAELMQRGMRPVSERVEAWDAPVESDALDQGLVEFLAQLNESWPE